MALTEERIEVQEPRETTEATEPTSLPPEAHRGWSPVWLLILGGAVAAVVLAVLAFRPDGDAVVTGSHDQVIEHGSPTAVDHAAQAVVPNHQQVIENGSPTAVDQLADWARTNGVTGLSPASVNADRDVSGQLADWARTNDVTGLSPASVNADPDVSGHAATTGGTVTGNHQQVIENGSPTAVDHAASS